MPYIDEIVKYTAWQSDLEILKSACAMMRVHFIPTFLTCHPDPPAGYLSPPVDIEGGLAAIRSRAAANAYKNQYDFDVDVFKLIASANDGHFQLFGCSMNIMQFLIQTSLVSISTDGVSIPQIYTLCGYLPRPFRRYFTRWPAPNKS